MHRFSRTVGPSILGLWALSAVACVDGGDDDGSGDGAADDTQGADGGASGADDDGGGGGDDAGADGGGGGGTEPSASDVEGCRESCDQLLFFDCLDADSHASCYDVCQDRTPSAIDLFDACVDNTLPECGGCWDNLLDAPPPSTGDGGDDGSSGAATCEDACAEWLGAGCPAFGEFDSCAQFCGQIPETLHDFVAECVDSRDGCNLPEECIFEDDTSSGASG